MTRSFLDRRSMMTLMATALVAPAVSAAPRLRISAGSPQAAAALAAILGPEHPILTDPARADLLVLDAPAPSWPRPRLRRPAIIGLADLLPADRLLPDPSGVPDPDFALDADLWAQALQHLGDRLARYQPDAAETIRAAAAGAARESLDHRNNIQARIATPLAQLADQGVVVAAETSSTRYLLRGLGIASRALALPPCEDTAALDLALQDLRAAGVPLLIADPVSAAPLRDHAARQGMDLRHVAPPVADGDDWAQRFETAALRLGASLQPGATL